MSRLEKYRWVGVVTLAVLLAPQESRAQDDVLPPQIVHEPCETYQKGKPFEIIARFYDDSPIFDPKVIYKSAAVKEWRNVSFANDPDAGDFHALIKRRYLKGELLYFIETFDEYGNGPARYGSQDAPIRVFPSENAASCDQTGEAAAPLVSAPSSPKPGDDPPPPDPPPAPDPGKNPKTGSGQDGTGTATATGPKGPRANPGTPSATTSGTGSSTVIAEPSLARGDGTTEDPFKAPQPADPKTGCDADDPPTYCSPWLWVGVGAGVAALAGGGVALWYFLDPNNQTVITPVTKFEISVTGGAPTDGFGGE